MSLEVTLYKVLTHGLSYDIQYYLEKASKTAGPILELGAGTGRISEQLLHNNHTVTGLDLSKSMCSELQVLKDSLEADKQQMFVIENQDMRSFSIDTQFSMIIVPLRTIQLLLSAEERNNCFKRCLEHLEKGGQLLLHLGIFEQSKADSVWRGTWEGPCADGWIEVDELLRYLSANNHFQLRHRIHQYNNDGIQVGSWRVAHNLTSLTEEQLDSELTAAGFTKQESQPMLGQDRLVIYTVTPSI
jgi:cyclopropane fatty-acyl-phospholipid synthase-like methyltransferase